MAQTACEMMWIKSLLVELRFGVELSMSTHCDNQAAIFITNNPTFHQHTKHIEVDCHYVKDLVMKGVISTSYTQSSEQLADIFTKGLSVGVFQSLCIKMSMIDMYAPV